jgi:signal transduction histidine kinase
MAAAAQVDIRLAKTPEPTVVLGDAQRLQQVVNNLLSNAIKFSPPGGSIEVTVTTDEGEVVVSVRDEGEGIDPAFLPHVFDRLRQADTSTTRPKGGLGLGLFIARHLTVLHGGTLDAHSAGVGAGAVFRVRLPAASTAAVENAADTSTDESLEVST